MPKPKMPQPIKQTASENDTSKVITVVFEDPQNAPVYYVTHMVLQHSENEFVVNLYQVLPPLVTGDDEQIKIQIAKLDTITAKSLARLVITADRMPAFTQAFQKNLDKYGKRFGEDAELQEDK